jgi:23S rRNA pseudouridine1911/1915/1917 synthase
VGEVRELQVPEGLEGERADTALSRLLGMSRSKVAELIGTGAVCLDDRPCGKSDRLSAGSWLQIQLPDPPRRAAAEQDAVGMEIIYEDDDLVVVDKPIGVATHGSPGWHGPTITAGLPALGVRLSDAGANERHGIVHRLDVGTSGVLVAAKSDRAYTDLKRQFKHRTTDKRYHAVVQGHLDPSSGTIDAPIGRDRRHQHRFAVVSDGRPSVTHYDTLEAFHYGSLVSIHLETGRTHQIRVHMAAMKHPCAGDITYGADPTLAKMLGLGRQWLHAVALTVQHPATGEDITFESSYPDDLASALRVLSEIGYDQ